MGAGVGNENLTVSMGCSSPLFLLFFRLGFFFLGLSSALAAHEAAAFDAAKFCKASPSALASNVPASTCASRAELKSGLTSALISQGGSAVVSFKLRDIDSAAESAEVGHAGSGLPQVVRV
jgi:hypothetical protein